MEGHPSLFPEIERAGAEVEPRGFRYQEEIVSEEEEGHAGCFAGAAESEAIDFHGHVGNRRVVSFGLSYDFVRGSVEPAAKMPRFLDELLARAAAFASCDKAAFRQVGVNEYRKGAGVGWHRDKPQFGIVVGVSLLAPATMRFRKADGARWIRVSHTLKTRSIYVLSGEARTEWEHSIPPVDDLRYSINFRTLSDKLLA